MSVHVTTQMKTHAEHTHQVIDALRQALPDSLQHEGEYEGDSQLERETGIHGIAVLTASRAQAGVR